MGRGSQGGVSGGRREAQEPTFGPPGGLGGRRSPRPSTEVPSRPRACCLGRCRWWKGRTAGAKAAAVDRRATRARRNTRMSSEVCHEFNSRELLEFGAMVLQGGGDAHKQNSKTCEARRNRSIDPMRRSVDPHHHRATLLPSRSLAGDSPDTEPDGDDADDAAPDVGVSPASCRQPAPAQGLRLSPRRRTRC